jgi:hypothetical protein
LARSCSATFIRVRPGCAGLLLRAPAGEERDSVTYVLRIPVTDVPIMHRWGHFG